MAITDAALEFSYNQALTATANSQNVVDLKTARDIAVDEKLYAMITLGVAADFTTTNETYVFALVGDDNDSLSSPTTLVSKTLSSAAERAAGAVHILPVPTTSERYLGMVTTLGGTTPSVTFSAKLVYGPDLKKVFPAGTNTQNIFV